jgi:hypothetical protein
LTFGSRGYEYFMKSGASNKDGTCGYVTDSGPKGLFSTPD